METEHVTEIAGIWSDSVGEDNILMVQLPEKKGEKRETKRKSSDDNQGRIKRCRAPFDLEQKEMQDEEEGCYLHALVII